MQNPVQLSHKAPHFLRRRRGLWQPHKGDKRSVAHDDVFDLDAVLASLHRLSLY